MASQEEVLLRILGNSESAVAAAEQTSAAVKKLQDTITEQNAKAAASTDTFAAHLKNVGSEMESVGKKMSSLGTTMTTHITLPVVAIGAASVKLAMDFDQSMTLIQTQAGASADEVAKMRQAILDMGGKVEQTPKQLADGLYWIESAGYRGAQALDVLRASSELAAVGQADMGASANAVTSVMKAMPGQFANATQAAAFMNAVVGNGKMKLDDLNGAISTGFLASAQTFGVSALSVGSALDTLTAEGIPAEKAATGLNMAMALMAAPTAKAKDILEGLGMSEDDVKGKTDEATQMFAKAGITQSQLADDMRQPDGLQAAITDLKRHLIDSGVNATVAGDMISKAFGGGRTGKAIMEMVTDTDGLNKKYQDVNASVNNFGQDVQTQSETSNTKWHEFVGQVETDAVNVGEKLLPYVMQGFNDIEGAVQSLAGWYDGLSPGWKKFIDDVGLAVLAFGPLLTVTGKVLSIIGNMFSGTASLIGIIAKVAEAWKGVETAETEAAIAEAQQQLFNPAVLPTAGAAAGEQGTLFGSEVGKAAGTGGEVVAAEAGGETLGAVGGGALSSIASVALPIAAAGAIAVGIGLAINKLTESGRKGFQTFTTDMGKIQKAWTDGSYSDYRKYLDQWSKDTGQKYTLDETALENHFGKLAMDQFEYEKGSKAISDDINKWDLGKLKTDINNMQTAIGTGNAQALGAQIDALQKSANTDDQAKAKALQAQKDQNAHLNDIDKNFYDTKQGFQKTMAAEAQAAIDAYNAHDYNTEATHLNNLTILRQQAADWQRTQQQTNMTILLADLASNGGQFTATGMALITDLYAGQDDPQLMAQKIKKLHDDMIDHVATAWEVAGSGLLLDPGGGYEGKPSGLQGTLSQHSYGSRGYAAGGWAGLNGPEVSPLGENGPEFIIPNHMLSAFGLGQEIGASMDTALAALSLNQMMGSLAASASSGGSAANLGKMMASSVGWTGYEWDDLYQLWQRESGWNPNAVNSSSGAYGIPQSLGHGHPYNLGDAAAQIAWGINYIQGRYGDPATAWQHEVDYGWYADGGSFIADRPGIFHAGERGPERVTVSPAGTPSIHIENLNLPGVSNAQEFVREMGRVVTSHRGANLTAGAF